MNRPIIFVAWRDNVGWNEGYDELCVTEIMDEAEESIRRDYRSHKRRYASFGIEVWSGGIKLGSYTGDKIHMRNFDTDEVVMAFEDYVGEDWW